VRIATLASATSASVGASSDGDVVGRGELNRGEINLEATDDQGENNDNEDADDSDAGLDDCGDEELSSILDLGDMTKSQGNTYTKRGGNNSDLNDSSLLLVQDVNMSLSGTLNTSMNMSDNTTPTKKTVGDGGHVQFPSGGLKGTAKGGVGGHKVVGKGGAERRRGSGGLVEAMSPSNGNGRAILPPITEGGRSQLTAAETEGEGGSGGGGGGGNDVFSLDFLSSTTTITDAVAGKKLTALPLLRKVLKEQVALFGAVEHPVVLQTRAILADIMRLNGEYQVITALHLLVAVLSTLHYT
jgi:hypothetical protein